MDRLTKGEDIFFDNTVTGLLMLVAALLCGELTGVNERIRNVFSDHNGRDTEQVSNVDGRAIELAVLGKMLAESDGSCVDLHANRKQIKQVCPELFDLRDCVEIDSVKAMIAAVCD
jgi:hypothetical protein